jgi:hypothetical protein
VLGGVLVSAGLVAACDAGFLAGAWLGAAFDCANAAPDNKSESITAANKERISASNQDSSFCLKAATVYINSFAKPKWAARRKALDKVNDKRY